MTPINFSRTSSRIGLAACLAFLLMSSTSKAALITSPNDLGNTVLWLDAADSGSISATGTAVDTWSDKSLAGLGDVSASGTTRPQTGLATQNGLNLLTFDGANHFLAGSAVLAANDDDYTYFAVWKPDVNGVMSVFEQAGGGTGERAAILAVNPAYGFNGQGNDRHDLVPYSGGQWRATALRVDNDLTINGANNIFIDDNGVDYSGTTGGAGPSGLSVGTNGTRVGAKVTNNAERFDGQIAEIIVFDRLLSDGSSNPADNEINDVMSYLDQKWNLEIAPSTITLVAVDQTGDAGAFTGAEWRTSSVVKPHDLDGDNVLGTDGWKWFGYSTTTNDVNNGSYDEESLPSYIASVGSTPRAWTGANGWALFDDPLNPGSDKQGTYGFSVSDFEIAIDRASSEAFRLTVFGSVASSLNQFIDLRLDGEAFQTAHINITGGERFYVYFDVPAGLDDLTLRVRRISGDQRGITGIAFDSSIVPEPSGIALAACGLVLFYMVRKRKWMA